MSMNLIRSPYPAAGGGGAGSPFMTAATIGSTRNNTDGLLGFTVTVGASNMIVTDLGRWRFSGNSQTHSVRIYKNIVGLPLIVSASIDMSSGTIGTWKYATITPVTLDAGVSYHIVSEEFNGGDIWGDDNVSGITTTADGTIIFSVYSLNGGVSFQNNAGGVKSYVPPNFKYHL